MSPEARKLALRVKELLTPKNAWIQGDYSRDTRGRTVAPDSLDAKCWCLRGAILHFTPKCGDLDQELLKAFYEATGTLSVVNWNDSEWRKHEDVLALLDKVLTAPSDGASA